MGYRIQNRRDTAARWAEMNPILLEGEIGLVTDNANQYKVGDGIHAWNDLPLRGFTGTISQELGEDENAVVSQKVVTEKLVETDEKLSELESELDKISIKFIEGGLIRFGANPTGKVDIDNPESNSYYKYAIVGVETGDFVYIDAYAATTVGTWCTLDENNNAVRSQGSGIESVNEKITINEGERKIVLNCSSSHSGVSYIEAKYSINGRLSIVEQTVGERALIEMIQGLIRFGANPTGKVDIDNVEIVESYAHKIIDVQKDDIIEINAYAATTVGTWCTLDVEGNAVRYGSGTVNRSITIQDGEVKLLINNNGENNQSYKMSGGTIVAEIVGIKNTTTSMPNTVHIAAYNSPDDVKKQCQYVCSGNNDQKTINQAIESLEYGGVVHLCAGNYIVDSFSEIHAFAWDCAIGPKDNGRSRHIMIEGDILPSNPNEDTLTTVINVSEECYDSIGDDAVVVIGTAYGVPDSIYYYRTSLSLKNIRIGLPKCSKPVIGVLQIHTSTGGCDNVIIYNKETSDWVSKGNKGHAPTPHINSVGFYGHPTANSMGYSIYNCCGAQGFGTGFAIGGDHNVLINCWTGRNNIGYSLGVVSECSHHNTLINCCSETDTQFMFLGDRTAGVLEPLAIINFQIEKDPEFAPEGDDLCCTESNPNTQWVGEITYSAAPTNTPFFEEGQGRLFKVRNVRHKLSGAYADRPTNPSYLQQYYDTELDRMLIWNGSTWKEL